MNTSTTHLMNHLLPASVPGRTGSIPTDNRVASAENRSAGNWSNRPSNADRSTGETDAATGPLGQKNPTHPSPSRKHATRVGENAIKQLNVTLPGINNSALPNMPFGVLVEELTRVAASPPAEDSPADVGPKATTPEVGAVMVARGPLIDLAQPAKPVATVMATAARGMKVSEPAINADASTDTVAPAVSQTEAKVAQPIPAEAMPTTNTPTNSPSPTDGAKAPPGEQDSNNQVVQADARELPSAEPGRQGRLALGAGAPLAEEKVFTSKNGAPKDATAKPTALSNDQQKIAASKPPPARTTTPLRPDADAPVVNRLPDGVAVDSTAASSVGRAQIISLNNVASGAGTEQVSLVGADHDVETTGQTIQVAPVGTTAPGQVADTSLTDQVAGSVQMQMTGGDRGQQIVVQLNPPQLGEIRISLEADGDGIRGILEVENAQTLVELQRGSTALIARLAEGGVELRGLEITLSDSAERNNGDATNSPLPDSQTGQHNPANHQQGSSAANSKTETMATDTDAGDAESSQPPTDAAYVDAGDGSVNVWM